MNTLQNSSTRSCSNKIKLLLLVLFTLGCALLGLLFGSTDSGLSALRAVASGDFSVPAVRILRYVRLPRVLASLFAGAAFAVSGILLQAVLENPLASPNVIGVNAGAGFFTFLTMALLPGVTEAAPIGAFCGALLATLLIYAIAATAGAGKLTLLLSGMAVSSMFTAGLNAIKTFFPDTLYNGSSFLIGGFSGVALSNLFPACPLIFLAILAALLLSRQADVLTLGEETAQSLGLPVKTVRFALIILASVLAGSAVSFAGLLSFVGLLVPHIARRLFGTSHRVLIFSGALLGASLVTLCDLLSRMLFAPYELPVGILLSLIGAPFFLFLLLHRRRGTS